MPGTQIVEFTTTAPSEFVRVSGGESRPTANWIMKAQDIAGLSPEQIASKFALPPGVRNAVGAAVAASIGGATGGAAGAATALNADLNNRQLTQTERARIKQLAGDDPVKQGRLTAAACALAHCADGIPFSDPNYAYLKQLQDLGARMTDELALLGAQKGQIGRSVSSPLFQYDWQNSVADYASQTLMGTRAAGGVQGALGVVGVAGSAALCTTVFGCALGAVTGTVSADYATAGVVQAATGRVTTSAGEQVLQSLGLSPTAAAYTYAAMGLSPVAIDAVIINRAGNAAAAYNTLARASYSDFMTSGVPITPEVMATPQVQAMIGEVKAAYPTLSNVKVQERVIGWLSSGADLPSPALAGPGSALIKVVPKGDGVSAFTPYWMSPAEARAIASMTPAQAGQALGLPAAQAANMLANGMDFYIITPKPGTVPTVFVSDVAPTVQGAVTTAPRAQQVIVPNRSLWTDAQAVNPFTLTRGIMHKYQLLRQRADQLLSALEEYAKADSDVEDFKRRFMPWYEKVQRREIRLPCYEYQLSLYFTNPDLSPLAERYSYGQPPNPLSDAVACFSEAMGDWLSDPLFLERLKASGEKPDAILDEQPPPAEEAPLVRAPLPESQRFGVKKMLDHWLGKK